MHPGARVTNRCSAVAAGSQCNCCVQCEAAISTRTTAASTTCGAAAALTLAAAACLAGNDPELMDHLPDVSSCSRNEIIYPRPGPYDYEHPIRASGAKLVTIDYDAADALAQIETAITPRTAAIGYVWLETNEQPHSGQKLAGGAVVPLH